MKLIFIINNYMSENLYVDFDNKLFATDANKFEKNFWDSEAGDFISENFFEEDFIPSLCLQKKTEYLNLIKYLKDNSFKELSFKYLILIKKFLEGVLFYANFIDRR